MQKRCMWQPLQFVDQSTPDDMDSFSSNITDLEAFRQCLCLLFHQKKPEILILFAVELI